MTLLGPEEHLAPANLSRPCPRPVLLKGYFEFLLIFIKGKESWQILGFCVTPGGIGDLGNS